MLITYHVPGSSNQPTGSPTDLEKSIVIVVSQKRKTGSETYNDLARFPQLVSKKAKHYPHFQALKTEFFPLTVNE